METHCPVLFCPVPSCPAHPEGSHCTCRYRGSTIRSRIFCVPGVEINVLSLEATFESRTTTTTALRTPLPGCLDVLDGRPTCLCWLIKSYRLLFWRCCPNTQHRYPRYRIGGGREGETLSCPADRAIMRNNFARRRRRMWDPERTKEI